MDNQLKKYLEEREIKYKIHYHPAVFTVSESKKLKQFYTGKHTKSLFLKDENERFYLVSMEAEKRLDIKKLKSYLKVKDLQFGSPEELKNHLNITPGSVSIFNLIYSNSVLLILDKKLWDAKSVGFHPNINIATLELDHENFVKFYNSLACKKEILDLE